MPPDLIIPAAAGLAAPGENPHERHLATGHLLANLKGRTLSSGVVTIVAQGIQFVLTMVSTMILARLLTPQDFGLIAMVMTIMGFLRVFKDAGLSTATVQREGITHAQVSNLFWINVGIGGFMSLLMAGAAPLIAWFYREPRLAGITLALSTTFLLTGLTVQHLALLNRQMRFLAVAVIQVGSLLTGALTGIGMALLHCGYWALVGSNVSLAVAALVLTGCASRWRPQWFARGSGTRPLVNFGFHLAAGGLVASLARGSDSLLIGRFYGATAIGLYSRAGALLTRPLEQFICPLEAVFVPAFSRLQTRPEHYRRRFLEFYEAIAMVSFLFTGLLFALADPLTLVVLGPKWENAAVIFAGLTFAALQYPVSTIATWLFASQGRGRDSLLASVILAVILVASFLCGLPFGPAGVAIAYSVSCLLVQLPILYHLAGRSGPVTTVDLWAGFLRHIPLWGVVCCVTWLLRSFVSHCSPLAQLAVCIPTGLLAGLGFIGCYPPARTVALRLWQQLRELKTFSRAT